MIDTLVIGAGPAGLAMAASLGRYEIPCLVLERGEAVGRAWHDHYDRLHLHTVREHSALPYLPFPSHVPRYVPRLQVIEYLEAYARANGIHPRFGAEVVRAERVGDGWEVRTRAEEAFRARHLVVATGYNRSPVSPIWPGAGGPAVLHSSSYRNGAAFRGQRVLVVGMGNTGAEIALDLHEHDVEVAVSVRSPVVAMPRDFLGMPMQVTAIRTNRLPVRVRDWLGLGVSRLAFGDLSRYGLGRPVIGPATLVTRGRIPLVDVGTIDSIRRGRIAVHPDVEAFERGGVRFRDGTRRPFEAVVLATGYRPRLEDFLVGAGHVTDDRGYPRALEAGPAFPGLYFLGFVNPPTGFLRQIALDAQWIAHRIAASKSRSQREP